MTQPVAYEKTTDFQQEETRQIAGRSGVRPAALDAELAAIELTISQFRANLAIIQRDDTKLRDNVVEVHTLSSGVLALIASGAFTVRGAWVTATAYALGDIVQSGSEGYLCVTAHTSAGAFATDLAANYWVPLAASAAALVSFTPAGGIEAITVQAAIEELDSEVRPGAALYLHQNHGGI